MDKQVEDEIIEQDFDGMIIFLCAIEKHMKTQDFNKALSFYMPLRNIIFEAYLDVKNHKQALEDSGEAILLKAIKELR